MRAETPNGTAQYRYDALGRRIAKHTAQGETRFQYDGPRLLAETDSQRSRTYLFEPGSFRPLVLHEQDHTQAGGAVYHYHLDHLGTPRELTDTDGRIVWSARYRAYGNLALADVEEIDNPLRFQGQYYDAETGLHYNLNRYYDPNAGRFIHQDSIGLRGGDNLYRYLENPLNWVDPLGLVGDPATATHITYVGVDAATRKPYVGYASMQGQHAGEEVLQYRYGNDFGRFSSKPDVVFEAYGDKATARGLEQHYFEKFGGFDGTANAQNPVGVNNPRRGEYLNAADKHLNPTTSKAGSCG
ncbi:RHS repeat-associated core domain-containing protein [Methylomonas sp. Kb3]|uniref:RHS repeat-associated core domain-containing protein n=1 Tax=Methylomonas sp. Kb3 TaxID=1611544 RepID=UPI001E30F4E4|nr:RHS repeat-associated core domain-containing protein [Methylomonas sp. Kb3]